MSDHDDDLLRRYRELPREQTPPALDASILAASRRATRKPLPRWAAPFSVAAVLVLALGLVLKVQRDAPEVALPTASNAPPELPAEPATGAPAGRAPSTLPDATKPAEMQSPPNPQAKDTASAPSPATPAKRQTESKRAVPARHKEAAPTAAATADSMRFAPEPPTDATARAPTADLSDAREEPAARSRDSLAKLNAAPAAKVTQAPMQTVTPASTPPPPAAASAGARTAPENRAQAARSASASSAEKTAADPLVRELERIAQLRERGRDDEADAALEAFRRAHPDYRIEPAMWEKVRRR